MKVSETIKIGLPRAFLYHRYRTLWKTFFEELGIETVVSPPTNKKILDDGTALAVDETCLSTKIYFGHVKYLIGKCDYILVPRITRWGRNRDMCTKFQALYDLTCNVFRDTDQKFLVCNIDYNTKTDEEKALEQVGETLGCSKKEIKKAYKKAKKEEAEEIKKRQKIQENKWNKEGTKIIVAAHSYVLQDAYIGKQILDYLDRMGVQVIRADIVDRKAALKKSEEMSPTMKWELNREIAGGIAAYKKKADGVILLSVFPCGPDSMTNEMIIRKNKDIPILHLVIDAQEGMAGVETRLESFLDIIEFRKGENKNGH